MRHAVTLRLLGRSGHFLWTGSHWRGTEHLERVDVGASEGTTVIAHEVALQFGRRHVIAVGR